MKVVRELLDAHGRRLGLFGVVGVSGIVVNTSILWALVTFAGVHHVLAAIVSSEVSILTNFALNDRFTFADHQAPLSYGRRAMHYNAVALSGMVISIGILAALTLGFGMYYLVANLIAIGASTLSNYVLNTHFTWALPLDLPSRGRVETGAAPATN